MIIERFRYQIIDQLKSTSRNGNDDYLNFGQKLYRINVF